MGNAPRFSCVRCGQPVGHPNAACRDCRTVPGERVMVSRWVAQARREAERLAAREAKATHRKPPTPKSTPAAEVITPPVTTRQDA